MNLDMLFDLPLEKFGDSIGELCHRTGAAQVLIKEAHKEVKTDLTPEGHYRNKLAVSEKRRQACLKGLANRKARAAAGGKY